MRKSIRAAPRTLGFTVKTLKNATLKKMNAGLAALARNLSRSKDAYGFFFYAGEAITLRYT